MLDKSVTEVIDSIRARVALPVPPLLFLTAAGVPSLTEARAGKRKAEVVLLLPSWWSVAASHEHEDKDIVVVVGRSIW
jgi:hypothetical protein